MSNVLLYHYQEHNTAPHEHRFHNASAWLAGLARSADLDGVYKENYDNLYKPAYNTFQLSRAPRWQKIAASFLSDCSLVLDIDREIVSDSLYQAFECVKNSEIIASVAFSGEAKPS